MKDDLQRLADRLDQFALFLRKHGETRWAEWIDADAERIRSGDYDAVDHFLSAFGGMGSINDLTFPDPGGMEYRALWQTRDDIAEPAYALAKEIQRRLPHVDAE